MVELVGIGYSPWSHKAKWALEYCGIPFVYREYRPGLGALGLRWRLRRALGKVSVPVLFLDTPLADGKDYVDGSYAIAQWAGGALFAGHDQAAILAWNDRCDRALEHGRARVISALIQSEAGLDEMAEGAAPKALAGAVRPLAKLIASNTLRKYQPAPPREALLEALAMADKARLAPGAYMLGETFSFADIAVACMLEVVEPVGDRFARRGALARAMWRDPELAEAYRDLLGWRDALCERHRAPRPSRRGAKLAP